MATNPEQAQLAEWIKHVEATVSEALGLARLLHSGIA